LTVCEHEIHDRPADRTRQCPRFERGSLAHQCDVRPVGTALWDKPTSLKRAVERPHQALQRLRANVCPTPTHARPRKITDTLQCHFEGVAPHTLRHLLGAGTLLRAYSTEKDQGKVDVQGVGLPATMRAAMRG